MGKKGALSCELSESVSESAYDEDLWVVIPIWLAGSNGGGEKRGQKGEGPISCQAEVKMGTTDECSTGSGPLIQLGEGSRISAVGEDRTDGNLIMSYGIYMHRVVSDFIFPGNYGIWGSDASACPYCFRFCRGAQHTNFLRLGWSWWWLVWKKLQPQCKIEQGLLVGRWVDNLVGNEYDCGEKEGQT